MRDLIVTENITLDGVIEATEGWFDPAGEDDVSDVETALRKQREAADALLLGRLTFEQMRGYWPLQTDDTTGSPITSTALPSTCSPASCKTPSGSARPCCGASTTSER
jgi:dihydrofolate reductase